MKNLEFEVLIYKCYYIIFNVISTPPKNEGVSRFQVNLLILPTINKVIF